MNAKIYKLKEKPYTFKLSLFTDKEIELTLKAVNMFSSIKGKVTKRSLPFVEPLHVINCLNMARINFAFFSVEEQDMCKKILETVERT